MGYNSDSTQNTITTTGTTSTSAVSYSFPANASGIVQVRVVGVDALQNTIGIESRVVISRTNGTCWIIGTGEVTLIKQVDTALASAGSTLAVNGSSIEVDVTGVAGVTINWAVRLDILYLN